MSAPLFILVIALGLTGCSTLRDTTAPPQTVERLAKLDFPADASYGPDLDILLVRSNNDLRLVNRTPNTYAGLQLWLNRQYVADSGTIVIGTDNVRQLTNFINRYKEAYPVGTFLNADQTQPLRHAVLYDPANKIQYRLLVRPGNEESIIPFEDLNN